MKNLSNIMKQAHAIAKTLEGNYIARLAEGLKMAWAQSRRVVVEKGTAAYKMAQEIANKLQNAASKNRWNNNSSFDMYFEMVGQFVTQISKLNSFAGQVAQSVDKTMSPYGKQVAYVSSKQAWILAVAAVENNINF